MDFGACKKSNVTILREKTVIGRLRSCLPEPKDRKSSMTLEELEQIKSYCEPGSGSLYLTLAYEATNNL